ncbi:type 2 periplasmic-binding domain-containing protein [Vallitalea okinawensis]|uniref:hypothetical protein n=1 Tax=Vallitalea okinawensis TaxID=2078660 RepID=UPI000CFD51B2|nr:hypothetical protein [Vallitalea okinawensis]
MKKLFATILVLSLSVSLLGGCSEKAEENSASVEGSEKATSTDNQTSNDEVTVDIGDKSETIALDIWTGNLEYMNDDTFAKNWLEERHNIEITYKDWPTDEQIRLMIATDEIPQWWQNVTLTDYQNYVDEEVIREIPMEYIEKYAPKYLEWIYTFFDDPWQYYRQDGKIYSMPSPWTLGAYNKVIGIRKDWMENVGVSETPETLEELEALYTKFRDNDPDQNGEKDTYAFTAIGSDDEDKMFFESFGMVFGAFDVFPNTYQVKDGTYVRGEILPEAKEALTVLNRWYENGLIDPEFMVYKKENMRKSVVSERVGSLVDGWYHFLPPEAFYGGYYVENMKGTEAQWEIIAAPEGPNGDSGLMQTNPLFNAGFVFGKNTTDAEMVRILQVINDSAFNQETFITLLKGEEGITYNYDEEDGFVWIPPYDDQVKRREFGIELTAGVTIGGCFNDYELQKPINTLPRYLDDRAAAEALATGKYDQLASVIKPVWSENEDHLTQMTLENYIKFIIGDRSLDEFDDYVQEWLNAGGQEVLEEADAFYKMYN